MVPFRSEYVLGPLIGALNVENEESEKSGLVSANCCQSVQGGISGTIPDGFCDKN